MEMFNVQLFYCKECPKGMTRDDCPVRKYMAEHPELFHETVNETLFTLATPYLEQDEAYAKAFLDMAILRDQCLQPNNQEVK